MNFDTTGMEKILESQFLRFIDTTPTASSPTWKLVGPVETGNAQLEFNPEIERAKWIVDKSARTNHKSNDKQIVLKVVEEINTKPLINKRSYKSYLIEISKDIELDKIIFERKSRYVITKTIYVKLHKEDIDVEDL